MQLQSPVDLSHGWSDSFQAKRGISLCFFDSWVELLQELTTEYEGMEQEQKHAGWEGLLLPSIPSMMPRFRMMYMYIHISDVYKQSKP